MRFGAMQVDDNNLVTEFAEKPIAEKRVNGGYFIFEPEVFNYLNDNLVFDHMIWEFVRDKNPDWVHVSYE
jgi:glucose-1-phosphate cytidylyltransferase